jgi:CRP/FNR family transcriptional regulator
MQTLDLDSFALNPRTPGEDRQEAPARTNSIRGKVGLPASRSRREVCEWLGGDPIVDRLFLNMPLVDVDDRRAIVRAGQWHAPVLLIRRGFAFRSYGLGDSRRTTTDILLPGDVAGLDQLHMNKARAAVIAAGCVSYQPIGTGVLRTWMEDPKVSMRVSALSVEAHWRAEWLAAIQKLSAMERVASLFISIHQRLRDRNLINGMSYNLPLTNRRVADYLGITEEHLSRTFRRMRDQRLVSIDKQVVTIVDFRRLHRLAHGRSDPDSASSTLP